MRRSIRFAVMAVVVASVTMTAGSSPLSAGRGGSADIETGTTSARFDALNAAVAAGTFGKTASPATTHPATGWVGEQVVNGAADDWEPAVATDPSAPYVYLLTTRYGQPKTCQSKCPSPFIALTISSDGGASWGDQVPLSGDKGSNAQYDPTIRVVPSTGAVDAVFLNADRAGGFSTVFITSSDHGKTWSAPVHVYQNSWTDKPFFTTSPDGKDVVVSWNGQTGGDPWIGVSHDSGATWTQTRLVDSKRYFYAYDAATLPDGTVVFAESSLVYSGGGVTGDVRFHAFILPPGADASNAASWQNVVVDTVPVGEACVADGCSSDFYLGQPSVATDASGHLVYAYEGPQISGGPQQIFVRTSSDEGRTWSARTALSVLGEDATQPRVASTGSGDVRLWYMQTAGHDPDAWNVWYRSSRDGGSTWTSPVRISDADAGAAGYINANGFDEIYGDYGEIGITSAGKTIGVWGEGFSWNGPGGCWFNIQR